MCSVLPHILSFKAQKPIGKTDIYNVLVAGGYLPTATCYEALKKKAKGGQFLNILKWKSITKLDTQTNLVT